MEYHFKVKIGYGPTDFIKIHTLGDLEKAQYAFVKNAKVLFDTGEACRGQDIISIKEDWHSEMGWNDVFRDEDGKAREYTLSNDDWDEIRSKGAERKYKGIMSSVKDRVTFLLENNQDKLIGKGTSANFLKAPSDSLRSGMTAIGDVISLKSHE
jgi:hypothetical protein